MAIIVAWDNMTKGVIVDKTPLLSVPVEYKVRFYPYWAGNFLTCRTGFGLESGGGRSFMAFFDGEPNFSLNTLNAQKINISGSNYWYIQQNWAYGSNFVSDIPYFTDSAEFYAYMRILEPVVTYNWQSVSSISGKNGISLLSHVRDDSILTGQDISNLTPAQVKLEGTTQISSLIANVPIGKAVKAIYAGKVDFLGIMKDNSASSTVRISVAGNNVYLASFISQKNYIGFIIDDEN